MAPLYAEPRLSPLDKLFVEHKWLIFEREDAIQNTWALKRHIPSRLRRRHSHGGYIPHALAILDPPLSPRFGRSRAGGRTRSHEDDKASGAALDAPADGSATSDTELMNDWPSTDDEWEPEAPVGDASARAGPPAPQVAFDHGAFAAAAAAAAAAVPPPPVQQERGIEIDQGGCLGFVGAAAPAVARQEHLHEFDQSGCSGFASATAQVPSAAPSPVAAQLEGRPCEFDQGSFLGYSAGAFVYGSPSFAQCGNPGFTMAYFGQAPPTAPAAPSTLPSPTDLGFYHLAPSPFRPPGALSPPHSNGSTAPSPARPQPASGPPSEISAAGSPAHWKPTAPALDLAAATSPPRFFPTAEPGERPSEPPPVGSPSEGVTTLMVRNLRKDLQRHELLEDMDAAGFADLYDFVYMPCSFEARESKGYAFMNFTTPQAAEAFTATYHRAVRAGITNTGGPALNVTVADVQGFEANMKKWSVPRSNRIRNPAFGPFVRGRGAARQPEPPPGRLPGPPVGAGPIGGDGGRGAAPLRKTPPARRPRVVGLALEHRVRSPALDLDSMLET